MSPAPSALAGGPFLLAHATHPDARMALALAAAQLEAQRAQRPGFVPTLALLYASDRYPSSAAEALLAELRERWPGVAVVGTSAQAISATGVEYVDEPALALMLLDLPPAQFQVFNGTRPLLAEQAAWTALVHADPGTADLSDLLVEQAGRTGSGYLFGGVSSSRTGAVQWADGVWRGGLSGVGFSQDVGLSCRVTQGCQPVGPVRRVTAAERNLVLALDDQPALPLLLADLGVSLEPTAPVMARLRQTLVGLTDAGQDALGRGGQFGSQTRVRHLLGLDPSRDAVAVSDWVEAGMQLGFCQRNVQAARRDLIRICTEIRAELEGDDDDSGAPVAPRQMAGAVYVSCTGRGGAHFGGPSAELDIVRHALGDVPLVGFFAGGEIAGHQLYGYTGVLAVFTRPA